MCAHAEASPEVSPACLRSPTSSTLGITTAEAFFELIIRSLSPYTVKLPRCLQRAMRGKCGSCSITAWLIFKRSGL